MNDELKIANDAFLKKNEYCKKETGHVLFSPSQLKLWDTCPGAFWLWKPGIGEDKYVEQRKHGVKVHVELKQAIEEIKVKEHIINDGKYEKDTVAILNRSKCFLELCRGSSNVIGHSELKLVSNKVSGLEGTSDFCMCIHLANTEPKFLVADFKTSRTYQYTIKQHAIQLYGYLMMYMESHKVDDKTNYMSLLNYVQPSFEDARTFMFSVDDLSKRIFAIKKKVLMAMNEPTNYISHDCNNPFCPAKYYEPGALNV